MFTQQTGYTEQKMQSIPRIVIGAPHGHSGKTTVSIGLVGALRQSGYIVQPFKKGPDYIDPSWLTYAAERGCRNLDCYWFDQEQILSSLTRAGHTADISVIEGAMGLFDGVDIQGTGSTAQVARYTQSPVILVVDTTRMTRSIAPLVLGFMHFDVNVRIAGVILNKVARSRHEKMLRAAIDEYCGIPVLGAIPRNAYSVFPERHLGLVPVAEHTSVHNAVQQNIEIAKQYLDLPSILEIANSASPVLCNGQVHSLVVNKPVTRIGIIRDSSFTFYYPENLEALEQAGAELVYINSLSDRQLPDIEGLYIGGGFPECFAEQLEANSSLRSDIRRAAESRMPIYAECGGLMYLGRNLMWQGNQYAMCGVFPFDVVVEKKPQGHGYTAMRVTEDNPFFPTGSIIKGHEFHHSKVVNCASDLVYGYQVQRGHGINGQQDGVLCRNTFATYNHIHALAHPEWAQRFVEHAVTWKQHSKAC